jgi:hypothetical protein
VVPNQEAVYDISILSNIPLPTYELLPPECPSHRLRPLFTIGVHDIPFLVDDAKAKQPEDHSIDQEPGPGSGWIACTTDSILAVKDTLWDMLITMPPLHASAAKEHVWPTVECPRGVPIKATQRDLRRYKALRMGLSRIQNQGSTVAESPDASPTTPRILTNPLQQTQDDALLDEAEKVVEPLSWAALTYNGFMWWASAGEQARSDEAEESAYDASLLANVSSSMSMHMPRSADLNSSITSLGARRPSSTGTPAPFQSDDARKELAVIAYFHRLTTQILTQVADIVENHSDCEDAESNTEDDDPLIEPEVGGFDGRGVRINSDALRAMGLDRWSASDAEFVKEVVDVYFGLSAYVEGKGVDVCGVRVC